MLWGSREAIPTQSSLGPQSEEMLKSPCACCHWNGSSEHFLLTLLAEGILESLVKGCMWWELLADEELPDPFKAGCTDSVLQLYVERWSWVFCWGDFCQTKGVLKEILLNNLRFLIQSSLNKILYISVLMTVKVKLMGFFFVFLLASIKLRANPKVHRSAVSCKTRGGKKKNTNLGVKQHNVWELVLSLLSVMFENNKTWQYDRYLLGALTDLNGLSVLQY